MAGGVAWGAEVRLAGDQFHDLVRAGSAEASRRAGFTRKNFATSERISPTWDSFTRPARQHRRVADLPQSPPRGPHAPRSLRKRSLLCTPNQSRKQSTVFQPCERNPHPEIRPVKESLWKRSLLCNIPALQHSVKRLEKAFVSRLKPLGQKLKAEFNGTGAFQEEVEG
jgi:hypothetical protein